MKAMLDMDGALAEVNLDGSLHASLAASLGRCRAAWRDTGLLQDNAYPLERALESAAPIARRMTALLDRGGPGGADCPTRHAPVPPADGRGAHRGETASASLSVALEYSEECVRVGEGGQGEVAASIDAICRPSAPRAHACKSDMGTEALLSSAPTLGIPVSTCEPFKAALAPVAGKALLHDFEVSGVHLSPGEREHVHDLMLRRGQLRQAFLSGAASGVKRDLIVQASSERQAALSAAGCSTSRQEGMLRVAIPDQAGFRVLESSDDDALCEAVYKTVYSDSHPNASVLSQLVACSGELARTLGHRSYAHMNASSGQRLAGSPEAVRHFLRALRYATVPRSRVPTPVLLVSAHACFAPWTHLSRTFVPAGTTDVTALPAPQRPQHAARLSLKCPACSRGRACRPSSLAGTPRPRAPCLPGGPAGAATGAGAVPARRQVHRGTAVAGAACHGRGSEGGANANGGVVGAPWAHQKSRRGERGRHGWRALSRPLGEASQAPRAQRPGPPVQQGPRLAARHDTVRDLTVVPLRRGSRKPPRAFLRSCIPALTLQGGCAWGAGAATSSGPVLQLCRSGTRSFRAEDAFS